jgi:3-oxoacyl-[acyl-carrier-protein] synthase-3
MSKSPIPLQILGTGEYIPKQRVDSGDFDRRWDKPPGWTYEQTGVASRAFCGPDENTITMGAAAAKSALANAGVDARQLDAIISIGSVPYQAIPCTAVFLQRDLDLSNSGIPAFDINATCLGFLVALDLVAQGIATGRYETVLIVASEPASVGLNWDDPQTAGLFGDGAAAVVVGSPRRPGAALLATRIQTFSSGLEYCQIRGGGSGLSPRRNAEAAYTGAVFEMQGHQAYKLAAELLPGFLTTLFEHAQVDVQSISAWVPHQASGRAVNHLRRALRIPAERIIMTLETLGNQVSASLPIALHRGLVTGRIQPGSNIALVGSGAGLAIGGAILSI